MVWRRFVQLLVTPVPALSLGFFRCAYGLVLLLFFSKLVLPHVPGIYWYDIQYPQGPDTWLLHYPLLTWLRPLPRPLFTLLGYGLCLCAVLFAAGIATRLCALLMTIGWSYVFLLDTSIFNNHYYLMSLLCGLLIFMPADAAYSVAPSARAQRMRSGDLVFVPFWTIFLLRFQLAVMYFFGGVTKLDGDWLGTAFPMKHFLSRPGLLSSFSGWLSPDTIARLEEILRTDASAYFFAWTGMAYDLVIVFLLLIRRTRILGFVLTVSFHAANHFVIFDDIEHFPLMATAATTIFLEPDWPRRVSQWLGRPRIARPDWGWFVLGLVLLPPIGCLLGWKLSPTRREAPDPKPAQTPFGFLMPLGVLLWCAFQILTPLRHLAIPGPVNWTQEGEVFSWRMKGLVRGHRPMRIEIEDPELFSTSAGGDWKAAWKELESPPALYAEVDPKTIDWRKLPPLLVVEEPLLGERIVWNDASRETGSTGEFGAAELRALWKRVFRREPATLEPSIDQAEAVRRLGAIPFPKPAAELAASLLADLNALLQKRDASEEDRKAALQKWLIVSRQLGSLAHGGKEVRDVLRQVGPLAALGAPVDGNVYLIRDDKLQPGVGDLFGTRVDGEGWLALGQGPPRILFPFDDLSLLDWHRLPRSIVLEDAAGQKSLQWNPSHDLRLLQARKVMVGPVDCHDYVRDIAAWWERRYGRRPKIRVQQWMALNGRPMQRSIDPTVDLASQPRYLLSHHDWIIDLEEVPVQPAP